MSHALRSVLLCCLCLCSGTLFAEEPSAEQIEFFEAKIRPLLINRCFECHGNGQSKGGLSLENRESFQKGSDAGAIVEPGKPDDSSLIEAIRHTGTSKMPPKQKLSDAEIADLTNGARFQAQPLPPFMRELVEAGGLLPYLKSRADRAAAG